MTRMAERPEDIHAMADEIARLMADRLGGARRGDFPDIRVMLRRRGGALPRKQRRAAKLLADADLHAVQPKIARRLDMRAINRAYRMLTTYLQPLGEMSRWRNRTMNFAASVVFGLLVLAALAIWLMVRRGYL